MRIACHQPNFVPWFPFFYKMAMVDYFIIMDTVQFEKNGFQNRFKYGDKWITNPVISKTELICHKNYTSGHSLLDANMKWIEAIKDTLNIKAKIVKGRDSTNVRYHNNKPRGGNGTDKIINLCKDIQDEDRCWRGQRFDPRPIEYVTNVEAFRKYLEEDKLTQAGINWSECHVPKHLRKSTFEILEAYGIEGARKQLPQYKITPFSQKIQAEEKYMLRQETAMKYGTESKEYKQLCKT